MKRPLVFLLLFLIAGILTGRYAYGFVLFFVVGMAACFLLAGRNRNGMFLFCFAVFTVAYLLGYLRVGLSLGVKDPALNQCANTGTTTVFSGTVTDISHTASGRQKLILASEGIKIQALLAEGEKELELGRVVTLEGDLAHFEPRRNPGGFDEFIYMRSRKIQYKMPKAVILNENGTSSPPEVISGRLRDKLGAVYDQLLPPARAGIAKSITLGDKSDLDDDIRELYQKAGVYHILVISGLHISIIGFAVLGITSRLIGKKPGGVAAIVFLVAYCLLTGCGVSTVRAVVMFSVIITGRIISRENDPVTCTAFACACLLLYEPLYLFDIGFQYSFLAVFGIVTMSEPLERGFLLVGMCFPALAGLVRGGLVKKYLLGTLAATLSTTPVLAFHFFYALPYSLLANLVILPSVSLTVGSAALSGITGLIDTSPARFVSGSLFYLLSFYEAVCQFFVRLPAAVLLTGRPSPVVIVLWYLCCAALVFTLSGRLEAVARRGRVLLLCVAALIVCQLSLPYITPKKTELTILDVSGGNCVIIHRDNKTYMIDCGGFYNADERNNSGVKAIAPYLDYYGIKKVDGFFSTYTDPDYLVNLAGLLTRKEIENFFVSGIVEPTDIYNMGSVYKIYPGDSLRDGDLSFRCLTAGFTLLFSCDGVNFLLMGEKEQASEREILDAIGGDYEDVQVIKLATNTAAGHELVRTVSPRVLAAGNSRYAFKWIAQENEAIAAELNIPLYDTADRGAVIFRIPDGQTGVATVYSMK